MREFDVVIVGLGPSGAILAATLNKDFSIFAIDKKGENDMEGFSKPCGGLLAPDAQKILSQLGLALHKDILVEPQLFSVKTHDLKSGQIRFYQRHYINLNRHKFDLWLKSKIPQSVETESNAVFLRVLKRSDGRYEVTYSKNGSVSTVIAKYVVGADGAASNVRRCLFRRWKIKKYMAIQEWFEASKEHPYYSCFFHSKITPSYAWGLNKDKHYIFGGAFKIKGANQSYQKLKESVGELSESLVTPIKKEACLVLSPSLFQRYCFGKNGAFFVGEAAGLISPSSLEGMSYAIESGYILAKALNRMQKNPNKKYARLMKKTKRRLFFKSIKKIFMYNPALRWLIMKAGIQSITPPDSDQA